MERSSTQSRRRTSRRSWRSSSRRTCALDVPYYIFLHRHPRKRGGARYFASSHTNKKVSRIRRRQSAGTAPAIRCQRPGVRVRGAGPRSDCAEERFSSLRVLIAASYRTRRLRSRGPMTRSRAGCPHRREVADRVNFRHRAVIAAHGDPRSLGSGLLLLHPRALEPRVPSPAPDTPLARPVRVKFQGEVPVLVAQLGELLRATNEREPGSAGAAPPASRPSPRRRCR
jgi:hypothetical protein